MSAKMMNVKGWHKRPQKNERFKIGGKVFTCYYRNGNWILAQKTL